VAPQASNCKKCVPNNSHSSRSLKAGCYRVQWQYKLFYILPHSPPMGVPVLWQDGPVVQFSHFLVSNVQSKFYRLDLLLLVFFLLNSNSNHQQFQSSDSDVVAVCGVTTVAPNCFKHGMSIKRISQSFRPQINR
jgi:hypothetical protein